MRTIGIALAVATLGLLLAQSSGAAEECSFVQGTMSCVTTNQYTETGQHVEYSGCSYGPTGQPGRRERTFDDTILVTANTTTLRHGREGAVYSTSTDVNRQIVSSTLLSDLCMPI
jgi:hypothetical protein